MLRKLRLKQKNGFFIKKTCNYMEQVSTNNREALVKTNRVSKYTISVQKLCYSHDKYKGSSKKILFFHYFSDAYEKLINKLETSQILKIKKNN